MNSEQTILIVDDDAYFRFALATELRAAGFNVQSAHDGDQAIQILQNMAGLGNEIDLVITDLVMPVMDGSRLSSELRKNYPEISILVITGYFLEEVKREFMTQEGIEFLKKPITSDELLTMVAKMISVNKENGRTEH